MVVADNDQAKTRRRGFRKAKPTLRAKEVEYLVARLESLLHDDAQIRVRERIPSRTGGLREVDVTVRVDVGGTPMLIILECRGRRRVEDVTWIEQLATKRRSVGATLVIGVSVSGFSSSAIAAAQDCGVALRTLDQLDGSDFHRWVPGFRVDFSRTAIDVLSCQVAHGEDWEDGLLRHTTCADRVFTRTGDTTRVSLHDLIEDRVARPRVVRASETTPEPDALTERMVFDGPFYAHVGEKAWRVEALIVDVKLTRQLTPMAVNETQQYTTPGNPTPHVARAILDANAVPGLASATASFVPSQQMLTFEIWRDATGDAPTSKK